MNAHVADGTKSSRSPKTALIALGNRLFLHRNSIFPVVFLAIVFLDRPRYPFGDASWDRILDLVGILLALSGQVIRALAIGLAYIDRGGKDGKVYATKLVQDGIFAHSRNPLYLGNILVFLGLFVVLNSRLGYLLGVPAVLVAYLSITLAEENFLRGKFGAEYVEYCKRVNRFLPSLRGLRTTLSSMRFDWLRVIRKEYGSTWTWMTAVVILLAWERLAVEGWTALRPDLPIFALIWGVIMASYLVVRFLKKTDRLGA